MEVGRTRETALAARIRKEAVIKTEKETEISLANFHVGLADNGQVM
jgi:hypothetical protein